MTRIIGIDCSPRVVRTGLTLAHPHGGGVRVTVVHAPREGADALDTLAGADFPAVRCPRPEDAALARQAGGIRVRDA